MSWIQKLYETYDACNGNNNIPDSGDLCPVGYSVQNAHIEVVIDQDGIFRRASLVDKKDSKTPIPVTEKSMTGRTSGIAPHPLCETLQYCAADYGDYGDRKSYFSDYLEILETWALSSTFTHEKVKAVYAYVSKKTLIKDLVECDLLATKNGKLAIVEKTDEKDKVKVTAPNEENDIPILANSEELHPIMKLLNADDKGIKNQAKVFVRWKVESDNSLCSETWRDPILIEKWAEHSGSFDSVKGFCHVTGEKDSFIAQKHPAKLRSGKDSAKLISSNDTSGFTFLGRFESTNEAASISSVVTQKAHSALRWLIGRKQAFRSGDRVFVTWAIMGKPIPDPFQNSYEIACEDFQINSVSTPEVGDVGQAFTLRFNKKLSGYKAGIADTEDIVVMGLDSASRGRLSIIYYRELKGSEFLDRIEKWHTDYAWLQDYRVVEDDKQERILFHGAPSPKDIAWCAFGRNAEGKNGIKLLNATVERLLPSIIDGRPVPGDLVEQCVRHASNRVSFKRNKDGRQPEFEKCLGISCSMHKGFYKERKYKMALEEDRSSRDYLYGRLLAVAEKIESMALYYAKENRETMAARLMQRFADRPYSTWRTIETSLTPYKARVHSKTPGMLAGYAELLDSISCQFQPDEFMRDNRLNGEFLLAYHCQRRWLREHRREKGQWVLKSDVDEITQDIEEEI